MPQAPNSAFHFRPHCHRQYREASPHPGFRCIPLNGQRDLDENRDEELRASGSGSGGYHSYVDTDSSLVMGTTYYYKCTVFADATQSKDSGSVYSKLLPAFHSPLLATPANRTGFAFTPPTTGIPNFTFTISNTALWDAAVSDYFLLTVRDKSGGFKYVGMFRYNFALSRFEAKLQGGGAALCPDGHADRSSRGRYRICCGYNHH